MARTLSQIIAELNPTYNPQIATTRKLQAEIPGLVDADIKQAEAKQTESFDQILGGARSRGLGFSGIPLGEQAKYSSTVFAPEVLRARSEGRKQTLSLEDTINQIIERRNTLAQQLREGGLSRELELKRLAEQKRQFNQDLALRRQQMLRSGSGGGGGGAPAPTMGMPSLGNKPTTTGQFQQRQDGGFNFTDAKGNPISAAKFAQLNKVPIGQLLYQMGQSGDRFAMQTYNAMKAAPGVAAKPQSLFWGM